MSTWSVSASKRKAVPLPAPCFSKVVPANVRVTLNHRSPAGNGLSGQHDHLVVESAGGHSREAARVVLDGCPIPSTRAGAAAGHVKDQRRSGGYAWVKNRAQATATITCIASIHGEGNHIVGGTDSTGPKVPDFPCRGAGVLRPRIDDKRKISSVAATLDVICQSARKDRTIAESRGNQRSRPSRCLFGLGWRSLR